MSSNEKLYGPIVRPRTPKFGSCLDKCVLGHDACVTESGAQLYKPPFESEEDCTNPDDVIVGRCTSSLDDERCGPTESACGTKSPFYEPIDNLCSIVDDDKDDLDGTRTTFPACQSLADVDVYQCVLDGSECKEGERTVYAKWAEEWAPNPCHCEDVPTGVCYKYVPNTLDGFSDELLTPENSFCAVSQDDCPSDHQWKAARDFLASELATYQCRLCDAQTIQGAYAAGACLSSVAAYVKFDASDVDVCAMESIDCDDEALFVSSAQLEKKGLFCPVEHTQNWGICGSLTEKVECTNKMDSCMYNFRFEQSDNFECNIHFSQSGLPTYFPFCSPRTDNDDKDWRDVRCVWDKAECDRATERWEEVRLPNDAWFQGCTCEDVFTGVCQDPSTGDYHCGVSKQACENPSSFTHQRDLQLQGIDLECPLCSPTSRPPPPPTFSPVPPPSTAPVSIPPPTVRPTVPLVPPPTKNPSNRPTKSPTVPTAWPNAQELRKNQSNDLSQGAIIAVAVAGAVVCALIVVIVTLATRTKKERAPQKQMYPDANADADADPEVVIDEAPMHQEELRASTSATLT